MVTITVDTSNIVDDTKANDASSVKKPINQLKQAWQQFLNGNQYALQLNLGNEDTLSIVAGEADIVGSHATIDTEGDGASDNLDALNEATAGDLLFLAPESGSRTVTLRHAQAGGNIRSVLGENIILDEAYKQVLAIFGGDSYWRAGQIKPSRIDAGFRGYESVAASIVDSTWATPPIKTAQYNNVATFSVSTFTFPIAGVWLLSGSIEFAANATGQRGIRLNHTVGGASFPQKVVDAAASGTTQLSITAMDAFNVGDTVGMQVYQSSGGPLGITNNTEYSPVLCAQLLIQR